MKPDISVLRDRDQHVVDREREADADLALTIANVKQAVLDGRHDDLAYRADLGRLVAQLVLGR